MFKKQSLFILVLVCSQMLAVTREVVGEIRSDGIGEELSRMKWISKGAVSLVGVVYGSVSHLGTFIWYFINYYFYVCTCTCRSHFSDTLHFAVVV